MLKNCVKVFTLLFVNCLAIYGQFSESENKISSNLALEQISVTIGGEFIVNGSFPSSSLERVDQFITRIFNTSKATILSSLRDDFAIQRFLNENNNYALREIELVHEDGNVEIIDLAKFRLSGDFTNNPYLKEGDVIIFPTQNMETNFISVRGAVKKEIKFQYVEGDDLKTALFFARGIDKTYEGVFKVSISRLSNDGNVEKIIVTDVNADLKLKSGDRIVVHYTERNNYDHKVLILGEVNQPGFIPISRNSTTLSEVIQKAGNFTNIASLKFSELIRDENSFLTLRADANEKIDRDKLLLNNHFNQMSKLEYLKMFRTANLETRDTLLFNLDQKLRTMSGFAQLDFRNLTQDSSYESNYIVKDGDIIIVPTKRNEVYVWGGVSKVGYYPYDDGYSVWDYLELAGGLTEIAYGEDEIYLIKGKSRNWILASDHDKLVVEPGDYIYVKKDRPVAEFWYYMGRVSAIATILGGLATIYLAFR